MKKKVQAPQTPSIVILQDKIEIDISGYLYGRDYTVYVTILSNPNESPRYQSGSLPQMWEQINVGSNNYINLYNNEIVLENTHFGVCMESRDPNQEKYNIRNTSVFVRSANNVNKSVMIVEESFTNVSETSNSNATEWFVIEYNVFVDILEKNNFPLNNNNQYELDMVVINIPF